MQNNDQLFDKLLTDYFSHEISEARKKQLFSMILESPSYKEQYEKAAKLNALLHISVFDFHKQNGYRLLKEKGRIRPDKQREGNNNRKFALWKRIAAAVILVALSSSGSIYLYERANNYGEPANWIETSTPLGGQTRLLLPDGSVVWVNAKSELKYSSRFGITDRNLYLSGEAYFEVNKNEKLPFSVQAGNLGIIATGTRFNVRSYLNDNKSEVDLLEGGIDVFVADNCYSLIPDEKIIYGKTSALAVVEKTDAYRAAQWTKGKLSFYQASIPEIYKMLERHFNVRIQIDSEELKEEYFLGSINLEMSLSEILSYLDVDKKYKIEVRNNIIIVRKR
jgi:ferric-dicitrate binding protein FerR (iron transport regulator)